MRTLSEAISLCETGRARAHTGLSFRFYPWLYNHCIRRIVNHKFILKKPGTTVKRRNKWSVVSGQWSVVGWLRVNELDDLLVTL
ncbi:MAG TPA: hypothetical protein VEV81_03015, partial [Pyrinomonadaceae bacterium]|nr:hypothetical protein [Pyrinomonadaceae bacterium]